MTDANRPAAAQASSLSQEDSTLAKARETLRREAEERLQNSLAPGGQHIDSLSPEEIPQVLHELQVHQIELEMQNEALLEAQLALDVERARYFDLYDRAPVGYCTVSEQGLILQANLTLAGLLGMTHSELLGQRWTRFVHRDDGDLYYLRRKKLIESGGSQSCELRIVRKDGSGFWGLWLATVSQGGDGAPVLRVVLSDVTERKLLDQLVQENNVELVRARNEADKANAAKSEFLYTMSHELRTPLHAILGFGQLLETATPPPPAAQKTNVDHILGAGWYLLALVDEILDLAVIESGTLALKMEPVSLVEVLRESLAMVEAQAQVRGIGLSWPDVDAPILLNADRNRLKQVLCNLLFNAIKYNRQDGTVAIRVAPGSGGRLRISVTDTGDGLSPGRVAQLFERFNRLGQESGTVPGTGIGLVVSKRVIELMGGAIGVDSVVGKGSVFWVELNPATERRAPVVVEPPSAGAMVPVETGPNSRTLLYIEDDAANLKLMEEIISGRPDIRLLTALDGERGLGKASALLPDVILMDINLPGISGIEAMRLLAQNPATAHIPVLALSANARTSDVEYGLAAGFYRYITKPIRIGDFMKTLDSAFEFSRSGASRTSRKEAASGPHAILPGKVAHPTLTRGGTA